MSVVAAVICLTFVMICIYSVPSFLDLYLSIKYKDKERIKLASLECIIGLIPVLIAILMFVFFT